MNTHIMHSVDTDGALTVTVSGGVELAATREKLLLFVLDQAQTQAHADVDPAPFVAPGTMDGDADQEDAGPARKRAKPKAREPEAPARGGRVANGGIADRIIAALKEHAPCTPRALWAACGLKSGPGPQHRTELQRLMAEGRVIADGATRSRTLTLAEGE